MFNFNQNNLKNANLFAAGLALGTVGLKVLTSKDAKKVYAGIVAAGLRAKETVLETAEKVQNYVTIFCCTKTQKSLTR